MLGEGRVQIVLHRAYFRGIEADRAHLVQPTFGRRELSKNERTARLGGQTRSKILQHRGERGIAGFELLERQIEILGVVIRRFDQPILQQPLVGILQELALGIDVHLLARRGEQILHRFNIRRDNDAIGSLDHQQSAREVPLVDCAARIFHQSRSQRALRLQGRRVLWIRTQGLLHVVAGTVALRLEQMTVGDALGRKREDGGDMIFCRFRFRAHVAHAVLLLNLRLRRLDLVARFCKLRGQEGDSAALDAGLARSVDGGRGFVQALFKERILRARQQPLVNLGQSQTGIGIRGITRLQLQIQLQGIVARRLCQAIRSQRRPRPREHQRFNRGGFRGFARGRRRGLFAAASMRYPCDRADDQQRGNGAAYQPHAGSPRMRIGAREFLAARRR